MPDWTDRAVVLSARPLGEGGVVACLLTASQGRYKGVIPGGQSRRLSAHLQPGTVVEAGWRARLDDQLGHLTLEPLAGVAGRILEDRDRLAALAAAAALTEVALPERAPQAGAFAALLAVLDALAHAPDRLDWAGVYARWEVSVLALCGFGLDLGGCALSGVAGPLAHVSPRSGRAVTEAALAAIRDHPNAPAWSRRLLPLPAFLTDPKGGPPTDSAAVRQALALTGHFLARHEIAGPGRPLPAARQRLVDRLGLWAP